MAWYSKVDRRVWCDEDFRKLSKVRASGQSLWLWLLTNDLLTALPGIFKCGERAAAEKLSWPLRSFRRAWVEVSGLDMASSDWDAGVISVHKAIHYNPPQSVNVIKSWPCIFDELPECNLVREHMARISEYVLGMGDAFRDAYLEAFPDAKAKACRIQEQEQKQEQSKTAPRPATHTHQRARTYTTTPPQSRDLSALNPDTEQTLLALRDHHAKLWGFKPRGFIQPGPDMLRIARVLAEYGTDGCEQIQRGHHKLKRDGRDFRGWRWAYPHIKGDPETPDWDWIAEHHGAGGAVHHHTPSEVSETPEQRFRRVQAEDKARAADPRTKAEADAALAALREMRQEPEAANG